MNPTHLAALQAAARRMVATYGEVVTVRRGEATIGPADGGELRAVRGKQSAPMNEATTSFSADAADWLFLPGSLTLDGVPVMLELGDVITAGEASFDCAAAAGESPSRYTDQAQTFLRVHSVGR